MPLGTVDFGNAGYECSQREKLLSHATAKDIPAKFNGEETTEPSHGTPPKQE